MSLAKQRPPKIEVSNVGTDESILQQNKTLYEDSDYGENTICPQMQIKIRGRKITLGECKFIFEKVWNVTVELTGKG